MPSVRRLKSSERIEAPGRSTLPVVPPSPSANPPPPLLLLLPAEALPALLAGRRDERSDLKKSSWAKVTVGLRRIQSERFRTSSGEAEEEGEEGEEVAEAEGEEEDAVVVSLA